MPQQPGLYKYTRPRFAAALLRDGVVRLGTLDQYRMGEHADQRRADKADGSAQFMEQQQGIASWDALSPFARRLVSAPGALFHDCTFVATHRHDNALVFCMSSVLSARAAGSYRACVVIPDPVAFARVLSGALQDRGFALKAFKLGPVRYHDAMLPGSAVSTVDPAYIKSKDFAFEEEWRIVWSPKANARPLPTYVDIRPPGLRELVAPVTCRA